MSDVPPRREILPSSIRLGRVAGVPIGLHYSWFIIAALITFSLAAQFRAVHGDWAAARIWLASGLTAILFFVSLLAHELAHALVARRSGLPVRSITLFALGGIAQIGKEATSASTEFAIAIVGPLTSAVIGIVCIWIAASLGWSIRVDHAGMGASMLGWLGSINLLLAAFNVIPGYPLDGGRILKAILWGIYKNAARASRNAARVGQVVAVLFIAYGLLEFFAGSGFSGLWLAFIGWFLLSAAQASYAQVSIEEALRNVRVGDLMANDCATIPATATLQSVVDDLLLRSGRRCVMVTSDGQTVGLITPADVSGIARDRWAEVTVGEVMRPLDRLHAVAPDTSATEAFTTMALEDVNQLPVMAHGHLEGIVSRGQIMRLLQSRSELKV